MDYMLSRTDGKHLSYEEFMESDIFGLMETELRIYNKSKKSSELSVDSAFDLI